MTRRISETTTHTTPDTEKMIRALTQELTPTRAAGPSWRPALGMWLAGLAAVILVFTVWLKPRPDLPVSLSQFEFIARGAFLLFGALTAGWAVQLLAIPGRASLPRQRLLALALPALLACAWAVQILSGHSDSFHLNFSEAACTEAVLVLGLLPGLLLFFQTRRQAPTHPAWSGALIGITSGLLASSTLSLHCANDQPAHLLAWHVLCPLLIAAGAGAAAGRRWLRW